MKIDYLHKNITIFKQFYQTLSKIEKNSDFKI